MRETFWERLDRFPPIRVRLLAKHPRGAGPLSTIEIAERSGLSTATVEAISQATSWQGIDIPTAKAFLQACDIDLANAAQYKRIMVYQRVDRPNKYRYLKRSAEWDSYYRPMRDRWAASVLR